MSEKDLRDKELENISGGTDSEKIGPGGETVTPDPPGEGGGDPTKDPIDPGMGGGGGPGDVSDR